MSAYLKDFYLLYTTGVFITGSPDNIVPRSALSDPSDLQLLFPRFIFHAPIWPITSGKPYDNIKKYDSGDNVEHAHTGTHLLGSCITPNKKKKMGGKTERWSKNKQKKKNGTA